MTYEQCDDGSQEAREDPTPGSKNESATSFYTRKKWKSVLQNSTLDLSCRDIDARGALVISTALLKNQYVTNLNLSSNKIGDEGATAIADMLRSNSIIRSIDLSCNGITNIGGIALASAFIPHSSQIGQPGSWNRSLFSITLVGNQLSDDTLIAFGNAAACNRELARVDLAWNKIGPQGVQCMMRSMQRNPLCNFILMGNRISDEGTVFLCNALKQFGGQSQASINLYDNCITYRGAEAISQLLDNNDFVQDLSLCGNTIGFRGVRELQRHLSYATCVLRSLNIADNMLGDASAGEVSAIVTTNLPTLIQMNVSNNDFTDDGATLIMEALTKNSTLQLFVCKNNTFGARAASAVRDLVRATKSLKSLNLSNCIESADHRLSITLAVGETDGVHVEMGVPEDTDDDNGIENKIANFLQAKADQDAQKAQEAKEAKKLRRSAQ